MSLAWRAAWWWVAALVAFNLFLHLPISDFFDGLARRYGFTEYDTVTRAVFLMAGLACAAWLWQPSAHGAGVRGVLTALGAIIAIAQALLVVNGIEAIHYPQYALLTWLLVRSGRSGIGLERSWLAATALGAIDEIWQWQTLPRVVPGYLDWNDIVLNAIGAALGVVVVVRMRRAPVAQPVLSPTRVAGALTMAGLIALLCGPLIEQPFYRLTPGGRRFHLLSPFEAVVCMAAVWYLTRTVVVGSAGTQPSP